MKYEEIKAKILRDIADDLGGQEYQVFLDEETIKFILFRNDIGIKEEYCYTYLDEVFNFKNMFIITMTTSTNECPSREEHHNIGTLVKKGIKK
jgi:hypothetical protein